MSGHAESFPVVAIGASAGGVDALIALFAAMPEPLPAPVIIAQHLDPAGQSHLEDIVGRTSAAPVRIAADGMALEPGTVYVIPANRHAEIEDGCLRIAPGGDARPIPSIDRLFTSIAREAGERAIAVVLTGTGSDGSVGAYAVKSAGGAVVIQDPATAAYPSMPRSVAAGIVDISAPVERIGAVLADLLARAAGDAGDRIDASTQAILDRLQQNRGVDFSDYKHPTISRRLHRRMVAVGAATPEAYLAYLEANPQEEAALVSAMLIKVTEFFRETALFAHLRDVILPDLLARAAAQGTELRIWSAGCATGEEAYSLAMLVTDLQEGQETPTPVRIFATDLDESAIAYARRGVYPAAALAAMPPEMIRRCFVPVDGMFEIAKSVRSHIVFGQHDLVQRPPFPNIDLILCRNVLIYFSPDLQDRVLRALAYSLNDGGFLVLGRSESTSRLPDLFQIVDRTNRIYRRTGPRLQLPGSLMPARPRLRSSLAAPTIPALPAHAHGQGLGHGLAAASAAPPAPVFRTELLPFGVAIIDRRYDIQSIDLPARRLLGIHGIALGEDFIHLAQRLPSSALRAAIDDAIRTGESASMPPVMTTDTATGEERHVAITCLPGHAADGAPLDLVMIVVSDVTGTVQAERTHVEQAASVVRLVDANRQLLAANQELTTALAETRSSTEQAESDAASAQANVEEILTLNEELQAANEELETLNEETQATLEELKASNDELAAREHDLRGMTAVLAEERDRLESILLGIGDAVVVVAQDGSVVLANHAWQTLLVGSGGAFAALDAHGAPLPADEDPLARAARGETFLAEFTTGHGANRRWHEAHGRPWRAGDLSGGVLVIRDVTDRSILQFQDEFLAEVSHELRTPLTVMFGALDLARRALDRKPERAGESDLSEYVDMSLAMARQQAALVDALLDTSRITGGALVLSLDDVDLGQVVTESVAAARLLSGDHVFTCDLPDAPVHATVDGPRVNQVLMILLRNAIDYSPAGSTVGMRLSSDGASAVISVTDHGVGISPENIALIFDRFGRAETSRRSHRRGLGLGLYIAHEIALAHGGDITVTSTPGQGSTFLLSLPLTPALQSAQVNAANAENAENAAP